MECADRRCSIARKRVYCTSMRVAQMLEIVEALEEVEGILCRAMDAKQGALSPKEAIRDAKLYLADATEMLRAMLPASAKGQDLRKGGL